MIVGISGKRGAGKDTLASYLVDRHRFVQLSLARSLKSRVAHDFSLTAGQLERPELKEIPIPLLGKTPRQIMIAYGQFFRSIDPNFWIKALDLKEAEKYHRLVCISDVRFKNEADYIRALGGIVVRLERKPELNVYGPTPILDISETDLDDYLFDMTLPAESNIDKADLDKFADRIFYESPARAQARANIGFKIYSDD